MSQPLPYRNPEPRRRASVLAWISIGLIAHVLASYGTIVVTLFIYGHLADLWMYPLAPVIIPREFMQIWRSYYTWKERSMVVIYVPVFCASFRYLFPKLRF